MYQKYDWKQDYVVETCLKWFISLKHILFPLLTIHQTLCSLLLAVLKDRHHQRVHRCSQAVQDQRLGCDVLPPLWWNRGPRGKEKRSKGLGLKGWGGMVGLVWWSSGFGWNNDRQSGNFEAENIRKLQTIPCTGEASLIAPWKLWSIHGSKKGIPKTLLVTGKMNQKRCFRVFVYLLQHFGVQDTTIADLAVGLCTGQIKTGAPCRSDRNVPWLRKQTDKRRSGVRIVEGVGEAKSNAVRREWVKTC